MKAKKAPRPIEGGPGNDLLVGTKKGDAIYGFEGDDIIVGRLGRDLMYGGDGSDTFAFDDKDTGDLSFGLADAIGDFEAEDFIDLRDTEVVAFGGFDNPNPTRGTFCIWSSGGSVYVTWNTYGSLHDLELTDFEGDYYNLLRQILWYEDDYLGSTATDAEIAPGTQVQGRIEVPEDQDWIRVEVEAGQLYLFDLMGQADGGGTLLDPYLVLYDENGNYVTDRYEELYFVAETPGIYFISAQSFGGTGTYTLEVTAEPYSDDFGNDITTSGSIEPGDSIAGEIVPPGDQDWLRIEVEAGQLYRFDLMGEADGGGTLVDPYLILYDENGNYVTESYEELLYYTETPGIYFIAATSGNPGTYTLEVSSQTYVDDFGGDIASAGEIAPGETVTGLIGVPADEDWFEIELADGETYTIDLRGATSGSGTLPDPYLRLLDDAGIEITADDDTNGLDSQIVYTAAADGTYYIAAREFGSGTGDYQLSVSDPAAGLLIAA